MKDIIVLWLQTDNGSHQQAKHSMRLESSIMQCDSVRSNQNLEFSPQMSMENSNFQQEHKIHLKVKASILGLRHSGLVLVQHNLILLFTYHDLFINGWPINAKILNEVEPKEQQKSFKGYRIRKVAVGTLFNNNIYH